MKTESTHTLEQRRNLMLTALENSPDALDSIVYELAITGIDRELNRRIWKRNVAIGLIVGLTVLATILFVSGCANTIHGIGADLQSVSKPYIVQGE